MWRVSVLTALNLLWAITEKVWSPRQTGSTSPKAAIRLNSDALWKDGVADYVWTLGGSVISVSVANGTDE